MKKLLLALLIAFSVVALVACGEDDNETSQPSIEISNDGYWVINGVKSEYQAVGTNGTNGTNGTDGTNGVDGVSPTVEISDDGYWVINGEKTNVKAKGEDGANGTNGTNGIDGLTPYIKDGNWWIGETDTGVKAEASANENAQGLDFYLKDDGTYAVAIGNAIYLSDIVVPSSYNGRVVTEIADYGLFVENFISRLNSIVIPDSVISIGENAFYCCDRLKYITVGKNNTVYMDIDGNLYTKDGTTLLQYAVAKEDESFIIPDGVTSIGDLAFDGCDTLVSITIPDSVTSIGECAFYGCDNLTSIKFRGTEDEWNNITKGSSWDSLTGNYTITYNYDGE